MKKLYMWIYLLQSRVHVSGFNAVGMDLLITIHSYKQHKDCLDTLSIVDFQPVNMSLNLCVNTLDSILPQYHINIDIIVYLV